VSRCSYAMWCLHCHREGHSAWSCKRPRSLEVAGPPPHRHHPHVVLNPQGRGVASAAPTNLGNRCGLASPMPPSASSASTPLGSPPHQVLPSPPPSPPPPPSGPPLGAARHQPRFETRVIPCTATIGEAEARLGSALVALIGGVCPAVSPEDVVLHLVRFYQVAEDTVDVHCYKGKSFLLIF
jgi:hypothetical protein